jgi:hypothetical protein
MMTLRTRRARPAAQRGTGDGGTAIVEFTFVAVLLLTIVFAIINFGLILSFKQDLTRAAAEGGRAAAVAFPGSTAVATGETATEEAVNGFDRSCNDNPDVDGLKCEVRQHDCNESVPDTNGDDPAQPNCVQVDLVYDYEGYPLIVPVPLISAFMPDQIRATSDSRINS